MIHTGRITALITVLLAWTAPAAGQQKVFARDGQVIRIAATEPNLIEAQHGRVTAFVFADGAFVQTSDHEAGVVYIQATDNQPHSGFVEIETDSGQRLRYSLVLTPAQGWPSQRVVLAEVAAPDEDASSARTSPPDLVAQIKELMRLLSAVPIPSAQVEQSAATEHQAQELRYVVLHRREQGSLSGEIARLNNPTAAELAISEPMLAFNREVLAVALTKPVLAAAASQIIYLIRRREDESLSQ